MSLGDPLLPGLRPKNMRHTAWIWFAGFGAWLFDGLVSLRLRNIAHAQLALLLSAMFLAAGVFYRLPKR